MKTSYGSITLTPTVARQLNFMTSAALTNLDLRILIKQLLTHAENLESRIEKLERASAAVDTPVDGLADVSSVTPAGDASRVGVVGEKRRVRRPDASVDGTG